MTITKYTRPRQLLEYILDQPGIAAAIQSLEPEVLSRIVQHVGLEDAGELIALATPAQLLEVFDEDLWQRESAGADETFDASRFALWIEILLESGPRLAARKVAEMDEDVLTFALCRNVLVIDIDELARAMSAGPMSDEVELLEKELSGRLYQELEQFRVISKDLRTWEAIRSLLLELDSEDPDLLLRLLSRCCAISGEYIEDNGGLYDVLSSEAMLEDDLAGDREQRRGQKGYVAPSLARSFLAHARAESLEALLRDDGVDPNTHAYFRDSAARSITPSEGVRPEKGNDTGRANLLAVLRDAEVLPSVYASRLLNGDASSLDLPSDELTISAAMRILRDDGRDIYARRLDELAYLANILLSGCAYQSREFRPGEAAHAALACCNFGAELLLTSLDHAPHDARALAETLKSTTLVKPFRIGWHRYFSELIAPVSLKIIEIIEGAEVSEEAVTMQRVLRSLKKHLAAGKPWRAIADPSQLGDLVTDRDQQILVAAMQEMPLVFSKQEGREGAPGFVRSSSDVAALHRYLAELSERSVHRRE